MTLSYVALSGLLAVLVLACVVYMATLCIAGVCRKDNKLYGPDARDRVERIAIPQVAVQPASTSPDNSNDSRSHAGPSYLHPRNTPSPAPLDGPRPHSTSDRDSIRLTEQPGTPTSDQNSSAESLEGSRISLPGAVFVGRSSGRTPRGGQIDGRGSRSPPPSPNRLQVPKETYPGRSPKSPSVSKLTPVTFNPSLF